MTPSARSCLTLSLLVVSVAPAQDVYVAPDGDDANAGTKQRPFATLERALEEARKTRRELGANAEPRIVLRRGTHYLRAPLVLEPGDSGLAIEAATGEKVILSGGRFVAGWKPYRGAILQADLSGLGLPDLDFRELYYNGRRQPLARVPNFDPKHPRLGGFLYNAGVVEPGSKTKFRYRPGELDPTRWAHPERGIVVFHPSVNYENVWSPLKSADPDARIIEAAHGVGALQPNDRYYLCDLFEELDAPGEWYVDPEAGILYFQPPGGRVKGQVVVPALSSAFVLQGDADAGRYVEDVRIAGLSLRDFRGEAVHMTGARNCTVAACGIRNVGTGVLLGDETHACRVIGCDITQTGGDGIAVRGTPGEHGRVSDHVIDNNYIWDFGYGDIHNRNGGVFLLACSHCSVTHNHIHDGPRYAIGMDVGNDNVIAYNYCHHVNLETCDTGIIEAATAWDWGKPDEAERNRKFNRGNEVHHNLLHDSGGVQEKGPGELDFPTFSWGIYLDLHCSGWHVHDNVVYNTVLGGFMLNCGLDNVVENNIFVDGKTNQVQFNPWPKYEIRGNRCERNIIAYRGGSATLYTLRGFQDDYCHFERNLVYAAGEPIRISGVSGLPRREAWAAWLQRGQDEGSILADPQFADPRRHDYRLKPTSPAFKLGFKEIDLSEVGNYDSPDRYTWPRPEVKVHREPADYTPPPPADRQPPLRDYESYAVGETERGANVGVEPGLSSVVVTDEAASSGKHSLKITDAAGQKQPWLPYVTYMAEIEEGVVHAGFDLRLGEGALFVYEWRDDPYKYNLGPNLRADAEGWLHGNERRLLQLPRGEWVRFDLTCALGSDATGTYDLTVRVPDVAPQEYRALACSPDFEFLSCVVVMSMTDGPSVLYLDNVELRPAKSR